MPETISQGDFCVREVGLHGRERRSSLVKSIMERVPGVAFGMGFNELKSILELEMTLEYCVTRRETILSHRIYLEVYTCAPKEDFTHNQDRISEHCKCNMEGALLVSLSQVRPMHIF